MNAAYKKNAVVSDIADLMEGIAPAHLAEEWDNCGLQIGSMDWPVKKIWVALDPLLNVIEEAGQNDVDMVVTHHPLIFKGLKRIDLDAAEGKIIASALSSHTAVYAAHTNLDSAADGVNEILSRLIGLRNATPLVAPGFNGEMHLSSQSEGLGRIGDFKSPISVNQLAQHIKKQLAIDHVKVAGGLDKQIRRAAVCSGSGSSLIPTFLETDADVYISGDLRYHDARTVEDAGRVFIDIGHFASEHIMIEPLVKSLTAAVHELALDVQIEPCLIEQDPMITV